MNDHRAFKIGDLVIVDHLVNTPCPYGIVMEIIPDFIISKRTLYWVELIDYSFRSPHHAYELTPTNGDNKDENRSSEPVSVQNNVRDTKEEDRQKRSKTHKENRQ